LSLSISQSRHYPFHVQVRPYPPDRFPVPSLGSRQALNLVTQLGFIDKFGESRHLPLDKRLRPVGKRPVEPFWHRRIEAEFPPAGPDRLWHAALHCLTRDPLGPAAR